MKIDSTGRPIGPKSVRPKEKSQKSKSGDFSKALTDQVATAGPVGGTTPINPVDAVLAAQEVGDSTSERRKACQRGGAMLDQLDELRYGMLDGTISQESLGNLSKLVRAKRENVDDPQLMEVLDEIELRAEVELAKLERE